jgi:hypothetical protein
MIERDLHFLTSHSPSLPPAGHCPALPIDSESWRQVFTLGGGGPSPSPPKERTCRLQAGTAAAILWNVELATS